MSIICEGVLLAGWIQAEQQGDYELAARLRHEADLLAAPFECMNCGVRRGTVAQGWRSCNDVLGASCRPPI